MTPCSIYIALLIAMGGAPSYVIAGRGAHPWWWRVLACLPVAGFFFLIGLALPSYPHGRNMDDWRRGTAMITAGGTLITAAAVQVAIIVGRWVAARRRQ